MLAGAPIRTSSGPANRTATTGAFSSPAAARPKPRITRCAGPAPASSASTSARAALPTRRSSSASTHSIISTYGNSRSSARANSRSASSTLSAPASAPSLRPRRRPSRAAGSAAAGRRDARYGLCAVRPRRRLYVQEYCRRLAIGWSEREIADLAATLKALPPDHPIVPLLRNSPDFASVAGLADALLHPQDRAYTVTESSPFSSAPVCASTAGCARHPTCPPAARSQAAPTRRCCKGSARRNNTRRSSCCAERWFATRSSPIATTRRRAAASVLTATRGSATCRFAYRARRGLRTPAGGGRGRAHQPQSHVHRPLSADRRSTSTALRSDGRKKHDRADPRRARRARAGLRFLRTTLALGPGRLRSALVL